MTRWGVIGPGAIAAGFADAMTLVEGGEIVAVASRSMDRANAYADRRGIERRYDSVDALVSDPGIDAVYVATPHSNHESDTIAALQAGKHVLCEKPLALDAVQARRMVDLARQRGLFLMEAIWTRFLPAIEAMVDVVASGRIGEVQLVEANFGFRLPFDPTDRHYDPAQGGGGLLDLGIYPVQLCSMLFGPPDRVAATGVLGATGVDELVAAVLHHPGGGLGIVSCGLRANLTCTGRITGTDGWIELPAFMHCPKSITVASPAGTEHIDGSYEGNGLRFEIDEVHRCLAAGLTESPRMPLDESLTLAHTLDTIRAQVGVEYPGAPS